jgi:hypothetical protein
MRAGSLCPRLTSLHVTLPRLHAPPDRPGVPSATLRTNFRSASHWCRKRVLIVPPRALSCSRYAVAQTGAIGRPEPCVQIIEPAEWGEPVLETALLTRDEDDNDCVIQRAARNFARHVAMIRGRLGASPMIYEPSAKLA